MTHKNFESTIRSLIFLSAFCLLIEVARVFFTLSATYAFLPWNLVLAWTPVFFALRFSESAGNIKPACYFILWLLFFPNAPYIITDLLHLKPKNDFPLWYDSILLYAYAFTGLILGMVSALIIYQRIKVFINHLAGRALMLSAMLLCGYGVYIGRYLRYNSWNILNQPFAILSDAAQCIIHPTDNSRTYGLTLMTGTLLYLVFMVCESFTIKENQ